MTEELIQKYMRNGKYTREEAIELIEWDRETDKMSPKEIMSELSPEEKKARKLVTNSLGSGKPRTTQTKKERKADTEKREIVQFLHDVLTTKYGTVEVTNIERMLSFMVGENKYEITLTKKRKS